MKESAVSEDLISLKMLPAEARRLTEEGSYAECEAMLCRAMARFPDAPQPHNLYGVLLYKEGDPASAMRHFRASWALDPAYRPAKWNITNCGDVFSHGNCAFEESDCRMTGTDYAINYNMLGLSRAARRS